MTNRMMELIDLIGRHVGMAKIECGQLPFADRRPDHPYIWIKIKGEGVYETDNLLKAEAFLEGLYLGIFIDQKYFILSGNQQLRIKGFPNKRQVYFDLTDLDTVNHLSVNKIVEMDLLEQMGKPMLQIIIMEVFMDLLTALEFHKKYDGRL